MERQLAAPPETDSGFTLLEMVISMVIVAIALALLAPIYLVVSTSSARSQEISAANGAIRPALIMLTNQVGSAGTLYSPCNSGTNAGGIPACNSGGSAPSGWAVLLYSESTSGATAQCSQWRVYNGLLQDRTWNPASTPSSLSFTTVATGVTLTNTSSQPPFALGSSSGSGADLLRVDFFLSTGAKGAPSIETKTAVAAQGQTTGTCSPPPTSGD